MSYYDSDFLYDLNYSYDYVVSVVVVPPTGDLTTGAWVESPLYEKVDELAYNDGDYINSDYNVSYPCELKLSGLNFTPYFQSGLYEQIIQYRVKRGSYAASNVNLNVELYCGDLLIKQITHKNIPESFTSYSVLLNQEEVDSITDYSDLSLRFFNYHNNLFENMVHYWGYENSSIDNYGKTNTVSPAVFTSTNDGSGLYLNSTEGVTTVFYMPNVTNSGFTLVGRVYAGNLTTDGIVYYDRVGLDGDYFWIVSLPDNHEFLITGVANGSDFAASQIVNFTNNVRYFIATVFDPISGKVSIYVNNSGSVSDVSTKYREKSDSLHYNFDGLGSSVKIDDTIIYQRALSSGEIMSIYNNGNILNWNTLDN